MNLRPWSAKLCGGFALLWAAGCIAGPKLAPIADDQRARSFMPSAGKAAIYVYRHSHGPGYNNAIPLSVDGRDLGSVANKTYYVVEVDPGSHDVWLGWGPDKMPNAKLAPIVVNAVAGQIYFVRAGSIFNESHRAEDPATGRKELLACCKLAAPSQPPAATLIK